MRSESGPATLKLDAVCFEWNPVKATMSSGELELRLRLFSCNRADIDFQRTDGDAAVEEPVLIEFDARQGGSEVSRPLAICLGITLT